MKDGGTNPELTPFQKAFADARAEGKETFTFEGESFTTKTAEEEQQEQYFDKYIQSGGPGSIDDILQSNYEDRMEIEERLNDPMNPANWATGAIQPMEGVKDPIFQILLGARSLPTLLPRLIRGALGEYLDDIPKNSYYRGLGKEGMDDALQSGVLRPRQPTKPTGESPFNLTKEFKELYVSPQSGVARRYGEGNFAVIPKDAAEFGKTYSRQGDWSMWTKENIPIDKVRLLRETPWGYKIIKNKGGKIRVLKK